MDKLLKFFGVLFVMVLSGLLTAFTLSTVWGWFIVPLGVVPINYVHAYGIALFLTLLFGKNKKDRDNTEEFIFHAIKCLLVLLFGYVTVKFM